jgi:2-polyprenyl-6-methoxyphenol hydroxylase-like FAD-dependent oxidoreductase
VKSLKVAVVGAGPAGLFLARLLRLRDAGSKVAVYERNPPDATFGFGVVFSDRTLEALRAADPQTLRRIDEASVRWTDMELNRNGHVVSYAGHGLTGIARSTLLRILREQALDVGAELRFEYEFRPPDLQRTADVVVLASGVNCAIRDAYAGEFGTTAQDGGGKYIWFGTRARFGKVSFCFVANELGSFAAHAYPYGDGLSTFIVTSDARSLRGTGMDLSTEACLEPGRSDLHSQRLMEEMFRDHLGGASLLVNNTKWSSFRVIRNRSFWHQNMVLAGDAAHTAHPSVGSGTKMAMEDSVALTAALLDSDSTAAAFASYERTRRPAIERTQRLAAPSMTWWETFGTRMHADLRQLGFHYLTRCGAISYAGLRRRDPVAIDELESWFGSVAPPAHAGGLIHAGPDGTRAAPDRPRCHAITVPVEIAGQVVLPSRLASVLPASAVATGAGDGGLVIADWARTHRWPPSGAGAARAWGAVADRVREHGGVPAARIRYGDAALAGLAHATGMALLEVALPREAGPPGAECPDLGIPFTETPVIVAVDCPPEPPWTAAGDRFAQWCRRLAGSGACAFHLGPAGEVEPGAAWRHLVDHADRIRAETRLPVLVDAPRVPARPDGTPDLDDWSIQLHMTILSGRADVAVAWPQPTGHDEAHERQEASPPW